MNGFSSSLLPGPHPVGRPRTTDLREVVNAILDLASGGCAWALLPKEFPNRSTVQCYIYDWSDSGILRRINHHLVAAARDLEGHHVSPTAGVIDSQSVKTTESGGVRSFDAGTKINGRKRHILTDTLGLMVGLVVHGADVQDRRLAKDHETLASARVALAAIRPAERLARPDSAFESGSQLSVTLQRPRSAT